MHLHANFKKDGYKGKAWKELLWNDAQASNMAYFEATMFKIYKVSEQAYQWFNDK